MRRCFRATISGASHVSDEIPDLDPERIRERFQGLNRDIGFPALNLSDMGAVQSRAVGKDILRPPALVSQAAHDGPDLLLDVLHLEAVSGYSG
jgi:hypothetical protein